MPGLIIWKNQRINRLKRDMESVLDRMYGEFGLDLPQGIIRGTPFVDLTETESDLVLRAEIPGVNRKDLDIDIVNDILTIKGEIKKETISEGENYHRTERSYGSFSRSLQLPCRVATDDVRATYRKGVLKIVMPKCSPESAKKVKIKLK